MNMMPFGPAGPAITREQVIALGPTIEAERFGIRMNAGVDQTASMALAIAFCSPIGAELVFSSGRVKFDSLILGAVDQNLSMTFRGVQNLNVGSDLATDTSGTIFELVNNATGPMFDVYECDGAFHWDGISFYGNQANQSEDTACAIRFRDAVSAGRSGTVSNFRVERFRGGGFIIGNGRNAGKLHNGVMLNCGYDTNGSILGGGKDGILFGANSDWRLTHLDVGSMSRNGLYDLAAGPLEAAFCNFFSNEGRGVRVDGTAAGFRMLFGSLDRNKMDGALVTGRDSLTRGYKRMFIGVVFNANSFDNNDTYHDIRALNCRGDLIVSSPEFSGTGATADKPKYNVFADGTTTDLVLENVISNGDATYATAFTNDESRLIRGSAPAILVGGLASNNATDATNDVDTSPLHVADDTGLLPLKSSQTIVKQIDVEFAGYTTPGTASGGRDPADNLTGAKWFNRWAVGGFGKPTDIFLSTSLTPTLPTGYTRKKLLPAPIYWNGSQIVAFTHQPGNKVIWTVPHTSLSVGTWDTTARLATLLTPLGRKVDAIITASFIPGAGTGYGRVEDPATTSAAVTVNSGMLASVNGSFNGSGTAVVMTNTSSQVRHIANVAGTGTIRTLGWIDHV